MATKVLAVPVATTPPKKRADDVTFTAQDVARVRLAKALARQSIMRLQCVQSAFASVRRDCIRTDSLSRCERDVQNVIEELEELAHNVGFALVCKP